MFVFIFVNHFFTGYLDPLQMDKSGKVNNGNSQKSTKCKMIGSELFKKKKRDRCFIDILILQLCHVMEHF